MILSLFPNHVLDPKNIREDALLIKDFRSTFLESASGKRVLKKILIDLRHFEEAVDPNDLIMQNYAKRILQMCGVLEIGNVDSIVEKYASIEQFEEMNIKKTRSK